ncbi:hypothetical protein ACA910_001320 [Epithemia clementina (nom. ined.)]
MDDNDIEGMREAVQCGPCETVAFPLRISNFSLCSGSCYATTQDFSESLQEIARQLGIILYNQALENFFLAYYYHHGITSSAGYSKHVRSCHKLLQMTETSLLSSIHCAQADSQHQQYAASDIYILLVLALSLNIMSVIFQSQHMVTKVVEVQHAVSALCSSDAQNALATSILTPHTCPAPAA